MKHEYDYHAEWTNGISQNHEIDLQLNLFLEDFLTKHRNIRDELLNNETGLRTELMNLIIGKLIRQIIDESGLQEELPGRLIANSNISFHNKQTVGVPIRPGQKHFLRSALEVKVKINSDRPVNSMQALYGTRGNVASTIADSIINLLKGKYLGMEVHEHETDADIVNDHVTEVRHRVKRSTSNN